MGTDHSEDIKHVWYFDSILEQIVLNFHVSPNNEAHVFAWVCCVRNDFKDW